MEDIERAQVRLENIRTVEPILGALRTISLGSWQLALRQRNGGRRYGEHLMSILLALLPHLPARKAARRLRRAHIADSGRVVALVIGSERGLCGRFNAAVFEKAKHYLDEQSAAGIQVEVAALGSRMHRLFWRAGRSLDWARVLAATALPSSRLAFDLTHGWLQRYEAGEVDAVDVVYSNYLSAGSYEPVVLRLIPPEVSGETHRNGQLPWPPAIIETDPLSLYAHTVEQQVALGLYECLLASAAAEHSTRYQLMESAAQNAERLIEELTIAVQTATRHAITREMQELAVGAGLLGSQNPKRLT